MRKKVSMFWILVLAFSFSFGGNWVYDWIKDKKDHQEQVLVDNGPFGNDVQNVNLSGSNIENTSFIEASKLSTPAVVYIKTVSQTQVQANPFDWFFDPFSSRSQITTGTGSGVIISKDGYIVTNNHVVTGAQTITVILNQKKREYQAELIGVDPSTDLALLKIDSENLPYLSFGNSDEVNIGEWVIAVGNPFNLTSTVTAGIVSAKGRNINIVNNQFPIESFIQTDAAINPGNSGGALVNLKGELVGINTAIASKTGSYSGYGFAIPSNIANKIVKDLIEYGKVQRGFNGLTVIDIDYNLQKDKNVSVDNGVYVSAIIEDSPADNSGLKIGDIILAINSKPVTSKSTYDEIISYFRPGDKLELKINRGGSEKTVKTELISEENTVKLIRRYTVASAELAADFTPLSKAEQEKYGTTDGIKVTGVKRGYIAQLGITDGFIITKYNGKSYNKAEELIEVMKSQKGKIEIEGIGPNGGKRRMSFYGY